ncbi:MAG: ferrochelatase [Bordetella sp.]|nr:MAG: ferrochelatase [Bordetella sp.]
MNGFSRFQNINFKEGDFSLKKSNNDNLQAVLLVHLGTPDLPNRKSIRKYLSQFLSDPRVIKIPKIIWYPILYCLILPIRSRKLQSKYVSIWKKDGSPLRFYSKCQLNCIKQLFEEKKLNIKIELAMRYGSPSILEILRNLHSQNYQKILIIPMYPQYSASTTASVVDEANRYLTNVYDQPELRFIKRFYSSQYYISAIIHQIESSWEKRGKPEKLIISFHGLPKSSIKSGDPYYLDCIETVNLIKREINFLRENIEISFQSRFGFLPWLKPSTNFVLKKLAKEGIQNVDVFCPGFVVDCLETIEEIANESRSIFLNAGGKKFHYIPALNQSPKWIENLSLMIEEHIQNW